MKLDISKPNLMLLVSALDDAIRYNEGFLRSETIKDITEYEEHLLCLENLQDWLEDEYKNLEREFPDLMKYEEIVRKT